MKKLFFILMISGFTWVAKAGNNPDQYTVTETFYGEKASKNANNPCQGSTIRQCAKRQTRYDLSYTTNSYSVYDKLVEIRNTDGVLIHTETGSLEVPSGTSIKQAVERDGYVTIIWDN